MNKAPHNQNWRNKTVLIGRDAAVIVDRSPPNQDWRNKTVLTARDLSVIFDKSLKSTYDCMKKGHFPTIAIGRSVVSPTHLIIAMLDKAKTSDNA